jgi:hypothetical protein
MDLDKLQKLAWIVLETLKAYPDNYTVSLHADLISTLTNFLTIAKDKLPEHQTLLEIGLKKIPSASVEEATRLIKHTIRIIELELASKQRIEELRIFEGADEKMKQAGICFRNGDYSSVINSLNTAFELILKDKIGIPTTITGINTSNVIDLLVKYNAGPVLYLNEARKHVLVVDNKIKHQGYSPSKFDCINGVKAMEELVAKLRNTEIKLSEEIRNKIYEGL